MEILKEYFTRNGEHCTEEDGKLLIDRGTTYKTSYLFDDERRHLIVESEDYGNPNNKQTYIQRFLQLNNENHWGVYFFRDNDRVVFRSSICVPDPNELDNLLQQLIPIHKDESLFKIL